MRLLLALVLLAGGRQTGFAQTPGSVLPPWTPGTLDIHQINTGRGNSAFFLFPDGTTMLVDAGFLKQTGPGVTPPRPDGSRPPGEWIARYVRHMLSNDTSPAIDYGYLTHFHDDHMGALTDVAERLPIRKMIDRGWPDYNYPRPLEDPIVRNYRAFLKRQVAEKGMKVEQLKPGRNDQIILLRERGKYPNFEVRNIAANGEIWTGLADNTRQHFPPLENVPREDLPTENMCSLAIRISYGRFDYFTGGDMPGNVFPGSPLWHDVETPVAKAVGPVEVMLLNHHGNRDAMNAFLVSSLRPQVFVISVWSSDHPGQDVLDRLYSTRLYPGPRDIFATNMIEANRTVIGPMLDRLKSSQGHILVRVAPGGESFRVIILDDSAETFQVKAVHGPYTCR